MPITIGQKLGRYRIEEEIGAGGMGVVYRAYDEKLERELAIKVLTPGTLDDPAARKRFRNEALVLSRLNHPSIQTIHDFDTIDGHDLLISELVQGTSLDMRLRSGALPEKEVVRLGVQLAQGLAAAHAAGVLHRDLKPANLRVTPDGRLKILDFGLATLSSDSVVSLSRETGSLADVGSGVSGTLPYMAPEQLLGEAVDERSDVFSAGIVLFELVTGRLPFAHALVPKLTNAILHEAPPEPRSIAPRLSAELERIILKCLEKEPEVRYQSAKELAADLRRMEVGTSRTVTAVKIPVANRRRRWLGPAVAGVLLVVAPVPVMVWRRARQERASQSVAVRWEQLTSFTDSAEIPSISPDGKMVAFLRGSGSIGSSANDGEVWFKPLPDGDPIQLTRTGFRKQTLAFSPDGTGVYFTQIQPGFAWNTFEVPLFGGQEPKLFMANATGLSWVGKDRLLFSAITHNVHMALMTSNTSRTDARFVHQPADTMRGMVHRSALSPDGKWVLMSEMNGEWFGPCVLAPYDGSSPAKSVGPQGTCTWAQWSPDGRWMYFTVDTGSGFHVWRQQFPDGTPEQITPSGASEEEGLAMLPDGKSFITAAGVQQSAIWLNDEKGERQITSEGYVFLPAISPDKKKLYYMRRVPGARSYYSGELWVSELGSGEARRLYPGLLLSHYAISRDGKKVVFATEPAPNSGIWIGELDGTQPPRQLTRSSEFRAFFGQPGQIIYEGKGDQSRVMRMNEDGSGQGPVSDLVIMQLQTVSPDGRWAVVGATPPGSHGEQNTTAIAVPTDGGQPITLSDNGSFGYGVVRMGGAPVISWTGDGKLAYISLRYMGYGSKKTAVVPVAAGSAPPMWMNTLKSDAEVAAIPGARLIAEENVYPFPSGSGYAATRKSAKTNLFRIYLSQ